MARVHYVRKARKDNPAVKAGQPYYWWQFRFGPKHYSATRPRASQLTQSEFYSTWFSVEEMIEDRLPEAASYDDFSEIIEEAKDELECLRDEQEDKRSNMPDHLQDSDTGELLQERYEACDEWINSLEGVVLEDDLDPEAVRQEILDTNPGC